MNRTEVLNAAIQGFEMRIAAARQQIDLCAAELQSEQEPMEASHAPVMDNPAKRTAGKRGPDKAKRKLSPEGIANIKRALKKRWAAYYKAQKAS